MAGDFGDAEATAASEEFLEDWRAQKAPASRAHSKRSAPAQTPRPARSVWNAVSLLPLFVGEGATCAQVWKREIISPKGRSWLIKPRPCSGKEQPRELGPEAGKIPHDLPARGGLESSSRRDQFHRREVSAIARGVARHQRQSLRLRVRADVEVRQRR